MLRYVPVFKILASITSKAGASTHIDDDTIGRYICNLICLELSVYSISWLLKSRTHWAYRDSPRTRESRHTTNTEDYWSDHWMLPTPNLPMLRVNSLHWMTKLHKSKPHWITPTRESNCWQREDSTDGLNAKRPPRTTRMPDLQGNLAY